MRFEKREHVKEWQLDLFETLGKNTAYPTNTVEKSLCALCTPRCGSTMFCEGLYNTGQIGIMEEWFNYEYFYAWQQVTDLDFTLKDYLTWVIERSTQGTGVFAVKWMIAQVYSMQRDFSFDLNNFHFDRIIYIERLDKIAQAVSMAKANKRNCFRSYETPERTDISLFDIARSLAVITEHIEALDGLGAHIDATLYYEHFQFGHSGEWDKVMELMGVPKQNAYIPTVKKQRDRENAQLRSKFRDFIGA